MASLLTFALGAPAHGIPARIAPINSNSKLQRQTVDWNASASTCASISAALIAAAGQALDQKNRRGRVVKKTLRKARTPTDYYAGAIFDPTKELGVMSPTGFWDPLNLMREEGKADGPFKSEETFRWYREAELKHGRVSMVALTGLFVGTYFKWPGFEGVKSGFAALDSAQGGAGLGMLILLAGWFEFNFLTSDGSKAPGFLGDNWGITGEEEDSILTTELRNKELAHCRMAMAGIFTAALLEYGGVEPEKFLTFQFISPGVKAAVVFLLFAWTTFTDDSTPATSPFPGAQALAEASETKRLEAKTSTA